MIMVHFRVLKRGTGAGVVRGAEIECGTDCAVDRVFGKRQTLIAEPAPGSTFAGWVGGCSTNPQCSLAVGPVTSIAAVFTPAAGSTPATAPVSNRTQRRRVLARLRSVRVIGHGPRRTIVMRLQVTEPAAVRVRLSRGGGALVSRRTRFSAAGVRVVRMVVPRRVHRGLCRLTVTVRGRSGASIVLQRQLRVPR